MFWRTVGVSLAVVLGAAASPLSAGYYSSMDLDDTRFYSTDYGNVFRPKLDRLKAIPAKNVEFDPPIRQRYMMLEALAREAPGQGGMPKLDTLEQKLNFTSVLIRRNRADHAARALELVVLPDHKDHFLVLSHYASALFLSGDPQLEKLSKRYMKKALEKWPKIKIDEAGLEVPEVPEDQKKFLKSFGWDVYDVKNYHMYETYFERLIHSRLKEKELLAQNKPVPETIDPIFVDDKGQPIRFVNERDEFEPGAIPRSAKAQMPKVRSIDVVEQLLIWMPNDRRLLWLLGEVFNASAMESEDQKGKNQAIANAYQIFDGLYRSMADPFGPQVEKYGFEAITKRRAALAAYQKAHPDNFDPKLPEEKKETPAWQTAGVGFLAGAAIGIFALWQVQEVRRRRQARAGAKPN